MSQGANDSPLSQLHRTLRWSPKTVLLQIASFCVPCQSAGGRAKPNIADQLAHIGSQESSFSGTNQNRLGAVRKPGVPDQA